ncbi:hypothetical protein [Mycetocola reblochoni]|uniref:Uncharacterized protein n=2 Tax=Mycetocola reblochoni TaxID=331618 RepID=A0A1R4J0Y7_9MICO|nr:hypothetical protein [Mycetocola reblochoni]RLP71207.1 hypothetical protein D9V30_02000 [Mycetocola reblochoni]SJN25752.1 hypothetical protein FM119_04755 [Mycetocola reblochoni REB411]
MYFSAAAIPGHVAMAGWKGSLLLVSPSLFVLANAVFTLGLAGAKTLIVVADRRGRAGSRRSARTAYRTGGALLLVLALAYTAGCLPYLLGAERTGDYDRPVALAIATLAFAELGLSIHGLVSSRRRGDLLMELNKLGNLSASLVLLVLTQTALLSMTDERDLSFYNGLCGAIMGALVALIATFMLLRPIRDDAHPPTADAVPAARRGDDVLRPRRDDAGGTRNDTEEAPDHDRFHGARQTSHGRALAIPDHDLGDRAGDRGSADTDRPGGAGPARRPVSRRARADGPQRASSERR